MKKIKISVEMGSRFLLDDSYIHYNSLSFYEFIRKNKDCMILEFLDIRFTIKRMRNFN